MNKLGDRVGTVLGSDNHGKTEFLGYGVYEGDEVPGADAICGLAREMRKNKMVCPKILLDSGSVVWGCECWWGSEDKVKELLANIKEVKKVDIADVRTEYRHESAGEPVENSKVK